MLELLTNTHVQAMTVLGLLIFRYIKSKRPVSDDPPLTHMITSVLVFMSIALIWTMYESQYTSATPNFFASKTAWLAVLVLSTITGDRCFHQGASSHIGNILFKGDAGHFFKGELVLVAHMVTLPADVVNIHDEDDETFIQNAVLVFQDPRWGRPDGGVKKVLYASHVDVSGRLLTPGSLYRFDCDGFLHPVNGQLGLPKEDTGI